MSASTDEVRSGRPWFWLLSCGLLAAGAYFRLAQFLGGRPLWLDEAMLALNVASRSYGDLFGALDYQQVAPPLFLWIERLFVTLAGTSELPLRAFSMVTGVALPALLALVAHRLFGPAGSLAALALAALSPTLVRYANEAKPYGSDAFVTVALLAASLAVRDRPASAARWMVLLSTGIAGLLLSIPAALVIPAALFALALDPAIRRAQRAWLLACALLWAATLAGVYLAVYRPAANNPYQHQGYEQAFLLPGPGWGGRALLALRGTVWPTFAGNGSHIPNLPAWALWVASAILLTGLVFVVRRKGAWAGVLLILPLVLAALASAVRRYPLGVPRLMVFAAPLLVLMAAGAVTWMVSMLRRHARPAFLGAAGLMCLMPTARTRMAEAKAATPASDIRSLVTIYRERPVRGEPVYVAARGIPTWLFYTTNWENPDRERLAFYARAATSGLAFENAPSRGRPVVNEGYDLVYESRRGKELLGIATGRQWRWPGFVRAAPDEGWAANEAARIASAAHPCAWMYFSHLTERANKPITWSLRDPHQGKLERLEVAGGAMLYRYCFPYTREQLQELERWKSQLPSTESTDGG